jgi:hypothetical protein
VPMVPCAHGAGGREGARVNADLLTPVCAHCGERLSGAEGTIWCAECFEWWLGQYLAEWAKEDGCER